jgi:hypothetical protein
VAPVVNLKLQRLVATFHRHGDTAPLGIKDMKESLERAVLRDRMRKILMRAGHLQPEYQEPRPALPPLPTVLQHVGDEEEHDDPEMFASRAGSHDEAAEVSPSSTTPGPEPLALREDDSDGSQEEPQLLRNDEALYPQSPSPTLQLKEDGELSGASSEVLSPVLLPVPAWMLPAWFQPN